ncbi:Os09g0249801 [Oryza sativa Japonica Group]|uniref:Uncharacterized protein n=2 Tax=Oryza sativa subsp. japonica TaxID=39947 RepID=Q6K4K8_ORYSJ|nr:hypothetical protein [Oryza sativa Japonica Group]BAD22213.1 hypothetical protein [Oryza sativa Japonica Group]BAT07038.1 Os09g0249801 [Oryza sativa Japonica Group]
MGSATCRRHSHYYMTGKEHCPCPSPVGAMCLQACLFTHHNSPQTTSRTPMVGGEHGAVEVRGGGDRRWEAARRMKEERLEEGVTADGWRTSMAGGGSSAQTG